MTDNKKIKGGSASRSSSAKTSLISPTNTVTTLQKIESVDDQIEDENEYDKTLKEKKDILDENQFLRLKEDLEEKQFEESFPDEIYPHLNDNKFNI